MAISISNEVLINLDKAIEALNTDKVLRVGWVENKRYPEEVDTDTDEITGGEYIAAVAAQNEYGAPHLHIPARPFMGPAIAKNRAKWMKNAAVGASLAVEGKTDILTVLKDIGEVAAGDVRKAIEDVTSPKLSPYTIARRLKKLTKKKVTKTLTKPLIDTGVMFAAVTSAVEAE